MLFDLIVSHHYVSSFKHMVDLLCGKAFSGGVFGNKQFSLSRVFLQLHVCGLIWMKMNITIYPLISVPGVFRAFTVRHLVEGGVEKREVLNTN